MSNKQKTGVVGLLQKMFRWDIIVGIAGIIGAIYTVRAFYKEDPKTEVNTTITQEDETSNIEQEEISYTEEDKKQELLERFCGSYSFVTHVGSINYVYSLVLDPINSMANWEEDVFSITNSLGYCGTMIKEPEVWEIQSFSINEKDNSAILNLHGLYSFYNTLDNDWCSVKLTFDDYDRIEMTFIEGSNAPAVLGDVEENGGETAIFTRDKQ